MPPLSPAQTRLHQPPALGLRTLVIAAVIIAMAVLIGLSLTGSPPGRRHDRLETTDQLYQQLTDAREEHAKAVVALESARADAAAAKVRQQNFLTAQITQPAVVEPVTVEPTLPQAPAAPVMVTNPAWANLTVQLNELNAAKNSLLERYTVEHPEVRFLNIQIAELDRSRAGVPELIPATEGSAPAPSQPSAEQLASAERVRREQQRVAALQEVAELQRQSDQAQLKLHAAESAESRAMERVASLAARLSQITEPQSQPASLQPATVWSMVVLVAALGVLASATIALGKTRVAPTFQTALEIEQELGLPVLGVIAAQAADGGDSQMLEPADFSEDEILV